MEALRTQPQSPSPSPLTGRMSSSDYPAPRRTARVRLPVLARPAETRQPPYLPSPLPSPPSCCPTPLELWRCGPPWRSFARRPTPPNPRGCSWLPAHSSPRPGLCSAPASSWRGAPPPRLAAPPRSWVPHYIIGFARCWRTATHSCARNGIGLLLSGSYSMLASPSWLPRRLGGRCLSPPPRLTPSPFPGPHRPDPSLRPYAPFYTPYA